MILRDKSSKNRFALNRSSFIINKIITSESVTQSIIEELHTCVSNRNSDRQGENRHGIRGGVVRKLPKAFPHEKLIKMVEEEGVGEAIKCYENLRNSNGLADMDDETVEIIKNLFPKPGISRDSLPQCNQDYAIKITEDDFLSALADLPRQRSPGLSGWTFELIKQICKGMNFSNISHSSNSNHDRYNETNNSQSEANNLLTKLVRFINYLIEGKGGSTYIWNAAKLIPLKKLNNGIRPIANNEV